MATLLELTQQGDVATISDESKLKDVKLQHPREIYALWERQPWQSHAIDFTQDRKDWEAMEQEKWILQAELFNELLRWFGADWKQIEKRGWQNMPREANRFYENVFAFDGTMENRLDRVREEVNDAFLKLFDGALVDANKRLIADPSDREAKVDFVTTYHMVIEGTLALTGQFFITDFFEQRGILPGFVEGFKNISQDEHRHVAYGTYYLQQACKDEALKQRMQDKLAELLPIAASVLVPKGKDPFGEWELLGYSSQEVNEFAFTALKRRLTVIGAELPAVAA